MSTKPTETEILQSRLDAARERLNAVARFKDQTEAVLSECQIKLRQAYAASKREREDALLHSRAEDNRILAAVAPLETAVSAARERLTTALGALERARQEVDEIHGDISSTLRRRLLQKYGPRFARIKALIDELTEETVPVVHEFATNNIVLTTDMVFPPPDSKDIGSGFSERSVQTRILGDVLDLNRCRAVFGRGVRL